MSAEDQKRERVITLVVEGEHDTRLSRRVTLNRQQMAYLCALLEFRLASSRLSSNEAPGEASERVVGAMQRVMRSEAGLSGLYHGGTGAAGVDHLLDYLGEVMAESDGHGLWEIEE